MTVTPASIKTKYPQFSDTDNGLIQSWLNQALLEVSQLYFGSQYNYAVELWTCSRLLKLDEAEFGTTGSLTSHSKDGVSWSFSDKGEGSNEYENEYIKLVRRRYRGSIVV